MPRIPEVRSRDAGWFVRLIYRLSRRYLGAVAQPVSVSAHHRGVLLSIGLTELSVHKAVRALPLSVRELAVYRVATKIGCSWCVDFGELLQLKEGLDIGRLKEIESYQTSEHYTELDRLVIEYADAMTELPMRVTDEQVAELDWRLGHRGVVELSYLISLENQRTRLNHALGITSQGFTTSEACRVPMS